MSDHFHIHPMISVGGGVFTGGILGALSGAISGAAIGYIAAGLGAQGPGPTEIAVHIISIGLAGAGLGAAFVAAVGVWLGFAISADPKAKLAMHGLCFAALIGPLFGVLIGSLSRNSLDSPVWILTAAAVVGLVFMGVTCTIFGVVMIRRYSE